MCASEVVCVCPHILFNWGNRKEEGFHMSPKVKPVHLSIVHEELTVFNKITFCRQGTSPISGLHSHFSNFHPNN